MIGNGSNCLFDSRGFRGCIIVNRIAYKHTSTQPGVGEGVLPGGSQRHSTEEWDSGYAFNQVSNGKGLQSPQRTETVDTVRTFGEMETEETVETVVRVGSGYAFNQLGVECSRDGLTGLEFASGIPGTVGGAVFMNAGAGGQVCTVLHGVYSTVWCVQHCMVCTVL